MHSLEFLGVSLNLVRVNVFVQTLELAMILDLPEQLKNTGMLKTVLATSSQKNAHMAMTHRNKYTNIWTTELDSADITITKNVNHFTNGTL